MFEGRIVVSVVCQALRGVVVNRSVKINIYDVSLTFQRYNILKIFGVI